MRNNITQFIILFAMLITIYFHLQPLLAFFLYSFIAVDCFFYSSSFGCCFHPTWRNFMQSHNHGIMAKSQQKVNRLFMNEANVLFVILKLSSNKAPDKIRKNCFLKNSIFLSWLFIIINWGTWSISINFGVCMPILCMEIFNDRQN